MRAFILSDSEPTTLKVRQVLLREGCDCVPGHVLSLGQAVNGLPQAPADVVVVVLSSPPDRNLSLLNQLRTQTQAPILAVGPALDSKLMLQVLRAGARDFIEEDDLVVELSAALARLRAETHAQAEPGRMIVLMGPNGGSGVSTLAANLATVMAREHKNILLIDLKYATGDLAALLDLKPTFNLADLSLNAARMDRVMFERSLTRHQSGVHLLAPPRDFNDLSAITPDSIGQTVTMGRSLFPYVLVDLIFSYREEEAQVLRQADLILLICRLDFTSLRNVQRGLEYLERLGIGLDRIRVVVNRYGQPKEVPLAKAEEALGLKIFHFVPEDAKTVNRANNNGVPLVLESPSTKVARSVTALAHNINGRPPER